MEEEQIYVLGAGSIGMALAVHLAQSGRKVTALRTSTDDILPQVAAVTLVGSGGETFAASIEMVSLAQVQRLAGIIAVTAKTYANDRIASLLRDCKVIGPLVIMQNGVGVEQPYLALEALNVYRCVLYATGQNVGQNRYAFTPVTASRIGIVRGSDQELEQTVAALNTPEFPFAALDNIQQEAWKKATINAAFNSICPLLETDNGIFVRDSEAARLARAIVDECVGVMARLGFGLSAEEVMQQLLAISNRSSGQLISTLQDINAGRETEIDHLNLAIASTAAAVAPDLSVNTTRVLGEMVKLKAALRMKTDALTSR